MQRRRGRQASLAFPRSHSGALARFCLTNHPSSQRTIEPEDEHGVVVVGALLVARCQSTPLLEAIEAPLDHVAAGIDGFVEAERPSWPNGALRTLVASLWNGVRDLSLPQSAPTARITIVFVGCVVCA